MSCITFLQGYTLYKESIKNNLDPKGRVQKFMLGKFVDFSIKWVGGLPLVH